MKSIKLLFAIALAGTLFTSCETAFEHEISLEEVISEYDLWYVDYHSTSGNGDVPFVSRAFTLSFINGTLYANNNIADIGLTGNGLGIAVGDYNTYNGSLEIFHDIDGNNNFEVFQIASNEIRIYNHRENVNYYLIGYQRNNFDYDQLFYENIEYFLQEYNAWEKTSTAGGVTNVFDNENYLQFTPANNTTFYASHDVIGTNTNALLWDFSGNYEIYDVQDYDNLKILTLNYDSGDTEDFELSVINDQKVDLYHINSATTYHFSGRGFVQYLKGEKIVKSKVRNNNRKRTIIKREKKIKK
jgi:hypothetical protein